MNKRIIQRLVEIVGQQNLLTGPEDLFLYGYDASLPEHQPEMVAFAPTTEAVAQILSLAAEESVPVVPRGAGTGLSGGAVPVQGGIALSLARMNDILSIDADNLMAQVQPGVVNAHLQGALAPYGLFYPPDPASMKVCTLGGNVAADSGGPKCFKYGVTRNYVLGLEVVLPDGQIIHTGGNVVKNTTGYDLTRLFVGSEGTLGVVTRINLRLLPLPEGKRTMLALFDSLEAASTTVGAIVSAGIVPSALEMMDNLLIQCAEDYVQVGLPKDAAAMLLIEVDGPNEGLDPQVETIEQVCREIGVRDVKLARSVQEADQLWLARRTVIGAAGRVRPSLVLQDVTVPRTQLPAIVRRVVEISEKHGLPIGVLAHAGDGNLHPLLLFDARNPDDLRREEEAEKEIFAAALELKGTITGEHGVGLTKLNYLSWEFEPAVMEITRRLKATFDPQNILNPGKIVAWEDRQLAVSQPLQAVDGVQPAGIDD
jgi:glycolate oxidase